MQKLLAAMQQHKEVQSLEMLSTPSLHTEREPNVLSVLSADSHPSEHSECTSATAANALHNKLPCCLN